MEKLFNIHGRSYRRQMTNKEKRDLKAFCKKVEELENSNAMKKCFDNTRVLLCLREEDGEPVNYVKNIPKGEDRYKLITIVRQLLSQKGKVSYYNICKILYKNNLELEEIKALRSYWSEILKPSQRQIGMFYDDKMLTNDEIIKIFFYGGLIHSEKEETIKKYQDFKENMGVLFEFWVFNVLFDLVDVAIRTKDLITTILNEESNDSKD